MFLVDDADGLFKRLQPSLASDEVISLEFSKIAVSELRSRAGGTWHTEMGPVSRVD